jgi:AraC-like DNA-binding protein
MAMSPNIRYHIEGRAYDLDIYDVIITNEKEIHRPSIIAPGTYERRFVQFKPVIFYNFFSDSYNPLNIFKSRELGKNNKIALSKLNYGPINAIFDELEQVFKTRNAKNMLVAKSLILRLISELEEEYLKNVVPIKEGIVIDERIENIIAELNQNFDKPFSLDEVSRSHFMDKYYLCHLFKEVTGFSLLEYVQSKRIQQAKMLISQGTGIMEAARISGFEEYSNFYKTFSKLVKMPPKKYKEAITAGS